MTDQPLISETITFDPPPPGSVEVVDIDGEFVAVAQLGGRYVAFSDTCTHRECPLSEGTLDQVAQTVTCPCHKSQFDLRTGQPLNGPAKLPLRVRRVEQLDGRLLIER